MDNPAENFWAVASDYLTHAYKFEKDKSGNNEAKIEKVLQKLKSTISRQHFVEFNELFSSGHPDYCANTETLVRLSGSLYKYASVPTFKGREDCGFEISDFAGVPARSYSAISLLSKTLERISDSYELKGCNSPNKKPLFCQKIALNALLLVGQHSGSDMWTTSEVREASNRLCNILIRTMKCQTLSELICDPPEDSLVSSGLYQQIMKEIKPKFQKDNWKRSPGMPRIFAWAIAFIKSPYMSDQIDVVLPPSLFLVDDHQAEYKVLGIGSLCRLMEECSREEIRWCGRGEVIYEALQHQLYSTEAEVLQATIPAIFLILEITEGIPQTASPPRPENRYDAVLDRLLQSMEMENTLVLRRIYTRYLPSIMTKMGITLCRHMSTLLRVIGYFLEIFDGPTEEARYGALDMLEVLIKATWPRIPGHAEDILKFLLKLVYDLSTDNTTTPAHINKGLIAKATRCGQLLRVTNTEKVDRLLRDVSKNDFNQACATFAQDVIEKPL